ncbi:hypothetical protein X772_36555 [Mesorhizobium sp. LSJC280B00]|nr:hypothetical protein X772_36555 [Mesorhizobium sp. LSJC280B00]
MNEELADVAVAPLTDTEERLLALRLRISTIYRTAFRSRMGRDSEN